MSNQATVFSTIVPSPTADEVIRQVEALILEGVLRVGDRLPGERDLARQLDVSRPILRQALKVLEGRGLLVSRHGEGTFVADVIGPIFTPAIIELIGSHRRATADYLEYRREIDAIAASWAARRATDADRALLSRLMEQMEQAHGQDDFAEEARLDVEFHNAVGESAHNIILLHTLRSCYRLLSDGIFYNRSRIYNIPEARDRLLNQHRAIYQAVMAGNPAAARRAAEAHIRFVSAAVADAEDALDRERVAQLRLRQRGQGARTETRV